MSKLYLVGGAVRDELIGVEPHDQDFVVVGSTIEEMLKKGYKQVGKEFPVFLDIMGNEVALARKERKEQKRKFKEEKYFHAFWGELFLLFSKNSR